MVIIIDKKLTVWGWKEIKQIVVIKYKQLIVIE